MSLLRAEEETAMFTSDILFRNETPFCVKVGRFVRGILSLEHTIVCKSKYLCSLLIHGVRYVFYLGYKS